MKRVDGSIVDSLLFTYIIEPHQFDYMKIFKNEVSIYDCIAEWGSYPGLSDGKQKRVNLLENKTVQKADIIFTVSQELYARRKKIKESIYYLPWAAEYTRFSKGADLDTCADLLKYKKPFIGFIGNIWGIFDLDLMRLVAESFPECSIILIGGLSKILPAGFKKKFNEICLIENVHWLGYKEHNILPDYLHYFDVCLMPYIINDWIKTCSPGKFYQYLAQGKSVVSVKIPEVEKYGDKDIVRIANDYDDFIEKVKEALNERSTEDLKMKRQNVARENTWQMRASKMLEILKKYNA
ncbi:MAG: glycosyltransferase [Bacteroidota bacterium]